MDRQPSLFNTQALGMARADHPPTAKQAARAIGPATGHLRQLVLGHLRATGPATDEAMQRALNMPGNTQRARRVELVDAGLVRDSGKRAKTSSGRAAIVWEVVQ